MGRPKKESVVSEAVATDKPKKEAKSFEKFWEGYKKNICNASEREQIIAEDAAKAAWEAK